MLAVGNLNRCTMGLRSISKQIALVSSQLVRTQPCHLFSNIKFQGCLFRSGIKELRSLYSFPSGRMFSRATEAPLQVGSKAVITVTLTPKVVELFAEATGDWNPVHFNKGKFKDSKGGGQKSESDCSSQSTTEVPIVHGALLNGIVSGVIGIKLPGPGTVVVSQEFRFPAPLPVGSQVTVEVEVVRMGRREVNVDYKVVSSENGIVVMDGTARLMVPKGKIRRVS